jgi:hypothetical protein
MTMMSSTNFNMGTILNKLRSIEEAAPEANHDPEMTGSGREIDNTSFTRTMSRLAAIKDAVGEEHYNDLKAGVRSMYMNRRPNLNQMTALMDLLETVLTYVSEDNALFQRLKADLNKDAKEAEAEEETTSEPAPEVGAPTTTEPVQQEPQGQLRSLK